MDLISVIIPVYGVEAYLDRCIESIVNQTYTNLEIILVDDGSPDGSPQICDLWGKRDKRIHVIHKQNGGLSDARNVGMRVASGKFIAFVDSDDWVNNRFIEFLYRAILESKADISACEVQLVSKSDEKELVYTKELNVEIFSSKEAIEDILNNRRFRVVVWNKLYRRELLDNEKFVTGKLHEDEFFSYRMYDKANYLAYIQIPLYYYFQRSGSIMSSFSLKHLDILDAYIERIDFFEKKYPDLVLKDKINFCLTCINLYSSFMKNCKKGKARAKLKISETRNKLTFTKEELLKLSYKEKMYVILSKNIFIGITSVIKGIRERIL